MSILQKLTRFIAEIVYLLKGKALRKANPKFLVFTGTVGKTTLRDTVTFILKSLNLSVESNNVGYSNELGILISAIGLSTFSPKSVTDWLKLLNKKIEPEQFVCIELGADFYPDISWFLKKFKPSAVFISGVANQSWSRNINEIFSERKKLLQAVPKTGYIIYNQDNLQTVSLVKSISTHGTLVNFSLQSTMGAKVELKYWSKNIYEKNLADALKDIERLTVRVNSQDYNLNFSRPLFEPQVYGILATIGLISNLLRSSINEISLQEILRKYHFSKNRLQLFGSKNKAIIIEDSYKATPLCTFWFLDMAKKIKASRKILVLTEMRPLTFSIESFYSELGKTTLFADFIYFLGPSKYYDILQKNNPKIKHIKKEDYVTIAEEILQNSNSGDAILLKGSFRYELENFRKLLL